MEGAGGGEGVGKDEKHSWHQPMRSDIQKAGGILLNNERRSIGQIWCMVPLSKRASGT